MNNDKNLTVAVLLSVYNGQLYLREQIDSILRQSYINFFLYIRDDGSTDLSRSIIQEYNDPRIIYLDKDIVNIGISRSYETLLAHAHADLYSFADQDDIWFENKLESLVDTYCKIRNDNIPILIYSNSRLLRNGKPAELFYKTPLTVGIDEFLFKNGSMQAASMIFNHKLKMLALPFPSTSYLHDVHIYLIALLFSANISFISEPLMYYRIHDKNTVGKKTLLQKIRKFKDYSKNVFDREMLKYIESMNNTYQRGEFSDYLTLMNTKPFVKNFILLIRKKYKINNSRFQLLIKYGVYCFFWKKNFKNNKKENEVNS